MPKLAEFWWLRGVDDISHEGLRDLLRKEGASFQVIKMFKEGRAPPTASAIEDGEPMPRETSSCERWWSWPTRSSLTLASSSCCPSSSTAASRSSTAERRGLMLAAAEGDLRVRASSSEAIRVLELLELQSEEGPHLDCFRTGEPVVNPDRAGPGNRWPLFVAAALEAGFRSAHALPMRLRRVVIGALNLLHSDAGEGRQADHDAAQAPATSPSSASSNIASPSKPDPERAARARARQPHRDRASEGHDAERTGVSLEEAFNTLRDHARSHNLRLADVARDIVNALGAAQPGAHQRDDHVVRAQGSTTGQAVDGQ
jgi:hypothetical protein